MAEEEKESVDAAFEAAKEAGKLCAFGCFNFGFGDKYFSFYLSDDTEVTEVGIRRVMCDGGFEIAASVRRHGRSKSMIDWSEGILCDVCGTDESKLKYFPKKDEGHACQRCASKMDTNLAGEVFGDIREWRKAND